MIKINTILIVGLLVVGLGGANGTTLLAGILANRLNIQWHGPVGQPMSPNYNGCITQIDSRGKYGTGGGYRDKVKGLANASMAAIGGWVSTYFNLRVVLFDLMVVYVCQSSFQAWGGILYCYKYY